MINCFVLRQTESIIGLGGTSWSITISSCRWYRVKICSEVPIPSTLFTLPGGGGVMVIPPKTLGAPLRLVALRRAIRSYACAALRHTAAIPSPGRALLEGYY